MNADVTSAQRRARITADIVAKTGITESMVERVVRGFYRRIRKDALLGAIFENHITDWDSHMLNMIEFWSSVTLLSGRYHGNPMAKHKDLPVNIVHFKRWLALFDETVREVCPPAARVHFMERAERIAQSLMMGITDMASQQTPVPALAKSGLRP